MRLKKFLMITICAVMFLSGCTIAEDILYAVTEELLYGDYEETYNDYEDNVDHDFVSSGEMEVWFIDVGQGDSALIISPEGKTMLIDCGEYENIDSVTGVLDKKGIDTLDVVIATHPHTDHMGGMATIFWDYEVKSVYMPYASANTTAFEKMLEAIEEEGLKINTAKAGVSFDLGSVHAEMFGPCSDEYEDVNDYSVIMKLTYGNISYLFTGDATTFAENEVLRSGADLSSNVLKVGHHGSNSSTSQEFLDAVDPDCAAICVGANNDYGHPKERVLKRLTGIPIYRTDQLGTFCISTDGETLKTPDGELKPAVKSASDRYVYITENGSKYHTEDCIYFDEDSMEVKESRAIAWGYEPCSKCA